MYKNKKYGVNATNLNAAINAAQTQDQILNVAAAIMEAFATDTITSREYSSLMDDVQDVAVKSLA